MFYKVLNSLFFTVLFLSNATAQDTWSLERCIEYAQKYNNTIKQSQNQILLSDLAKRQASASRLPNLSFSSNVGGNFGRTVNPATNTFENSSIGFNSTNINANQIIYDGGRIKTSIAQANMDKEAAQADLEQSIQNIGLSIASAYLDILLGEEQLAAAKKRFEQSKEQATQIEKLIVAGSRPANDKYDFVAQSARNEQAIVTAQNAVDLSYLRLKQFLELDPEIPFKIERPLINIPTNAEVEGLTLRAIYNQAYSRQPQIKAGELRLRSAELNADIAKSDLKPTISFFGSISSNYSTFGQTVDRDIAPQVFYVPNNVTINNVPSVIVNKFEIPYTKRTTYFDQIVSNFGQALGLSIQVPIYDRGITRIAVERARLGAITQQLQNQQTQNQLKIDIQTAIANAKAAKKQLDAAEKTFNAAKKAFENAEVKYKVGSATPFEMTTTRNNMDTAERDFIVAKYDYLFKLKIIDFYQGKKISLN